MPSIHIAAALEGLEAGAFKNKKIISAVKGVLPKYNILLNQYLEKQFDFSIEQYFTLLGPSHAEEVAAEQLSYLTFSGVNPQATEELAAHFKTDYINTRINDDVWGVQYAGVAKNIYALGAGIAHGLEYGDNVLLSAIQKTKYTSEKNIQHTTSVYLGDLLVTCYSLHSRNRTFGNMIGKGYSVKAAELELNMVAEGYNASKCIMIINESLHLNLPIIKAVYQILWEGHNPSSTFKALEGILI